MRLRPLTGFHILLACLPLAAFSLRAADSAPRLAVLISIDQFRQDYLLRFSGQFCDDGFKRLLSEGTHFDDCHFRHSVTTTAAGHSTIATGVHGEIHGIIGNEWIMDDSGRRTEAVEDPHYPIVGKPVHNSHSPGGVFEAREGRSPQRLLAPTIGDQLKLRYGPSSRVMSIAQKDRAAILMGGHLADQVYWFDDGCFVSSQFYMNAVPAWVQAFNAGKPADVYFGATWDRLLPQSLYDQIQGADKAPGEEDLLGMGITFPRTITGGQKTPGADFYDALHLCPQINDLLLNFAENLIRNEHLGSHPCPDLLCIGFSQIDYAGHAYGPDSHEMMDSVLRLDRVIASLLHFLDDTLGKGNYVVVLTADHGSTPLPERIIAQNRGLPAGRFDTRNAERRIESALSNAFGRLPEGQHWSLRDGQGFRLVEAVLNAKGITRSAAAAVIRDTLNSLPEVAAAWTKEQLLALPYPAEGDSYAARMRRSIHAERSADVVFILRPNFVDRSVGTTHGSPYDCDDHVPLLWWGAHVGAGTHKERVGVDDLAPTLCSLMNIARPPQSLGHVLLP